MNVFISIRKMLTIGFDDYNWSTKVCIHVRINVVLVFVILE